MTTPADHDKRCPAAWDTSVKCNCGAQAADEIALIEKTLKSVGITSLLNHGAASCVFTEGCCGVSQEHILAYTRKIALHCAVALAAPPTAQAEGWISVDERLPEHEQAVAFVVRTDGFQQHLNGCVLGGCFVRGQGFFVPGLGLEASHWMPLPPPPTSAEGVEHG